jgi:hypothetical protein
MSELQLGLLAIGAGVIASVFLYNKWQEREYRRRSDAGLPRTREDVLLGAQDVPDWHPAATPGRVEPVLGSIEVGTADRVGADALGVVLSEQVDFVVPIETAEEISGGALLQAAAEFQQGSRFANWEGFDEGSQSWESLRADQKYSAMRAGLQLSDRRGAATAEEIAKFGAAVEKAAAAVGALATPPEAGAAAARAAELDRFCSDVDIRVAVHVVTDEALLPDRFREFAHAAGFEFDSEGGSLRRRGTGRILCTLANMKTSPRGTHGSSAPERGLTLEFDVPRSARGDFDQFRHLVERLARQMGGQIVDDNGQALGPAAFDAIRDQVNNLQESMEARGIDPAGALALRLFS